MSFKRFEFPLYIGDNSVRGYDLISELAAIKDGRATLAELDMASLLYEIRISSLRFRDTGGPTIVSISVPHFFFAGGITIHCRRLARLPCMSLTPQRSSPTVFLQRL